MKMKKILAFLITAAMLASFAACTEKDGGAESKDNASVENSVVSTETSSDTSKEESKTEASTEVSIEVSTDESSEASTEASIEVSTDESSEASSASDPALVGGWSADVEGLDFIFVFNDDGTGAVCMNILGENVYQDASYKIDGAKLTVDTDEGTVFDGTYEIKDGKLIMTMENDPLELTRCEIPERPEETSEVEIPIEGDGLACIENDACKITLISITDEGFLGKAMNFAYENKSDSKDYNVSLESLSVNGVELVAIGFCEVEAGNTTTEKIYIYDDSLETLGAGEATGFVATFEVTDAEDFLAEPLMHEELCYYPLGEDKAVEFKREPADTDVVMVDKDGFYASVISQETDEFYGYVLNVYFENNSDKNVYFDLTSCVINGKETDPFSLTHIGAGKGGLGMLYWDDEELGELGVTEIESIEMGFEICDYNTFDIIGEFAFTYTAE